jgi:hypothetical protein
MRYLPREVSNIYGFDNGFDEGNPRKDRRGLTSRRESAARYQIGESFGMIVQACDTVVNDSGDIQVVNTAENG